MRNGKYLCRIISIEFSGIYKKGMRHLLLQDSSEKIKEAATAVYFFF